MADGKENSTKSDASSDASSDYGGNSSNGSLFGTLAANANALTEKLNWGKMAASKDFWADASEEDDPVVVNATRTLRTATKRYLRTVLQNPSIIVATLVTFSALLAAGLATLFALEDAYASDRRDQALITARELGLFISSELDRALLPLFAMSQFVKHLDDFKQLPFQIGPRGELGAAPPLPGKEISHRNVTGICDDPHTAAVFRDIAASVKKDAGMEGILVSMQLAPQSVVCLLHPLVNTEDFPEGVVMNNTGAVGHDLLNDPNRVAIARATVPAEGVVIAGPLPLIQGDTSVVKEAFIARLAINMPGYSIRVDGVNYPCWGFAVILLNWAAIKERSKIDERFEEAGMVYQLTRTDVETNTTTVEDYEKVRVCVCGVCV